MLGPPYDGRVISGIAFGVLAVALYLWRYSTNEGAGEVHRVLTAWSRVGPRRQMGVLLALCLVAGGVCGLLLSIHPKGEPLAMARLSAAAVLGADLLLTVGTPAGAGYLWGRRYGNRNAGVRAGAVAGFAFGVGAIICTAIVAARTPGTGTYRGLPMSLIVGIPFSGTCCGAALAGLGAGLGALGALVGMATVGTRGGHGVP